MPERPLLVLPQPGQPVERVKRQGFPPNISRPTRERQGERLAPRFEALQQAIDAHRARFQMDAQGLVPEDVVVLETVGAVERFVQAVERIPGMEWLAEVEDVDMPPDDDFFARNSAGEPTDRPLSGRLFMVFANQAALDQMLSFWRSWQAGRSLARGQGPWTTLFAQLRDVRRWDVRDRLHETGVLDDWRERAERGEAVVPCELELWHRGSDAARELARNRVVALVEDQGGEVLDEATISEIAYQAILATLPVQSVRRLLAATGDDLDLVQCEQIQFIRGGQVAATPTDDDGLQDRQDEEAQIGTMPVKPPTVALLDGLCKGTAACRGVWSWTTLTTSRAAIRPISEFTARQWRPSSRMRTWTQAGHLCRADSTFARFCVQTPEIGGATERPFQSQSSWWICCIGPCAVCSRAKATNPP